MGSSSSSVEPLSEDLVNKQANEIFTTTMSPYCPGLLISDCPSGKASELKVQIRNELQSGKTTQEVRTELQQRYNKMLDARPPTDGFGSLMWIVPVLLLLIGALFIAHWLRSQVKGQVKGQVGEK